jgi:predicted XRE-type DNA-binding protein
VVREIDPVPKNWGSKVTRHLISQVQPAKKLRVDPSRINEIVKYRIDLYTVDKLMDLAERLDLDFDVKVA